MPDVPARPTKGTRAKRRWDVLNRDAWTCRYCGGLADTVDHVIPRIRGGPTTRENLVAACARCNEAKGDLLPSQWERVLKHGR